ncbi:tRNA synthetases class II-domain-containing protein [Halteromyces radiatus]|uniref:tRNA synthetases class II-domain-containing protein n=1 Tax=Halteromyces radiatus TaxID=101107 RepID=UPI00221EB10B|nr:tRNA synthetases class II-domain-containing protein [Halteromyces radiatus]KAI8096502.1 tRNA synthetases class II-domain-containing protein [Halteromyces radiatus]
MLCSRPWGRYGLSLQNISRQALCRKWISLTTTRPLILPRRSFIVTSRVQDQHLHGYKDVDRYHGQYPTRTHMCGELRPSDQNKHVVLCGWAQPSRSMSQELVFLPIRDASGTTQLVYRAEHCPPDIKTTIQQLSTESVICVEGIVRTRPEGTINHQLPTGGVEVDIQRIYCLNPASPQLPFWPSQTQLPNEEMRLKYRYLDLRRPTLQNNIRLRSLMANTIRQYLIEHHQFTEIETPTLFKSTPEGAREFVVPTRKPGLFYALPQSPQQHKQMLMAAGFDRYFQIARCFRDEDLRADRQPEFTQIDLEMSFVSARQVQQVIEGMVAAIWSKALGIQLSEQSFPHMTYQEAMTKYGSDKPDLRFDLQIQDMSICLKDKTKSLDCLVVKNGASQLTGGDLKSLIKDLELTETEQQLFGFVKINENNIQQWPLKCGGGLKQMMQYSQDTQQNMNTTLNVEPGDLIFLHQRPNYLYGGNTLMGRTRLQVANQLQRKGHLTIPHHLFKFTWIESFPLFTPDEQGIRTWQATHHPFTAPFDQDIPLLATDPAKVRGQHYDLVLNGMEIGGGSIRIHSPVMQTFIFDKVLQLEKHEYERFDHLIDALGGGCPPHGGIALGFDRLMAILCQANSIRDVIAFPKAAGGKDFVVDSPSQVTVSQLKEYGLQILDDIK